MDAIARGKNKPRLLVAATLERKLNVLYNVKNITLGSLLLFGIFNKNSPPLIKYLYNLKFYF